MPKISELPENARKVLDALVTEFAKPMAKDNGMSLEETKQGLIELIEGGMVKILEKNGHFKLYPVPPDKWPQPARTN